MPSHCFRKTSRQKTSRRLMDTRAVMAEPTSIRATVSKMFEVLATTLASGNREFSITPIE